MQFSVQNIKIYHIVLFVFGILLLLGGIQLLYPEGKNDTFGLKTKFLSVDDFAHPKKQEKANVDSLIIDIDTNEVFIDTIIPTIDTTKIKPIEIPVNEAVESFKDLQFDESGQKNLYQFFEKLASTSANGEKISILHYGDSQLEGDRMTGFIRHRIQSKFGGKGPGLIPATNIYNTISFQQTYSNNFKRHTAFGGAKLKSKKYGAMASASRFTPEYEIDSTFDIHSLTEQTAWIEIQPSKNTYSNTRQYSQVKMFYNECLFPTFLTITENGNVIFSDSLISDGNQHSVKLNFNTTPQNLRFEFKGKVSPNICGFALEGTSGVNVANIAMRGSSGTVFTGMNHSTLRRMYNELNINMIVLQYGGNSVPFFKDSSGVRNYARYFKSQLKTLQNLCPNAMILVIGPSDMSHYEDGIYNTYPFLPYTVEQMIKVTKEVGGAYWNLYASMGGKNSMPSWVEKGWAGKDYIHFSISGSKIASQSFYKAFNKEFNRWEATK